jgi:hypothetical protein
LPSKFFVINKNEKTYLKAFEMTLPSNFSSSTKIKKKTIWKDSNGLVTSRTETTETCIFVLLKHLVVKGRIRKRECPLEILKQ